MKRHDLWWWLSAPYSLAFATFVVALRLPLAGVAHALALFFLIGILCILSSLVWLLCAAYKALRTNRSLFGKDVLKRALTLVALLMWAAMFALPQ
jgi:hypothetical protein